MDILINPYLNLSVLQHLKFKKNKDPITSAVLSKIHVLINLEKIPSLYHVNAVLLLKEILSVQKSTLWATLLFLQKFHRSYQIFTSAILLIDSTYMNACFWTSNLSKTLNYWTSLLSLSTSVSAIMRSEEMMYVCKDIQKSANTGMLSMAKLRIKTSTKKKLKAFQDNFSSLNFGCYLPTYSVCLLWHTNQANSVESYIIYQLVTLTLG